jgi:hypothetical protein
MSYRPNGGTISSTRPPRLVARDSSRSVVASTPVASVAFWHRQNR